MLQSMTGHGSGSNADANRFYGDVRASLGRADYPDIL